MSTVFILDKYKQFFKDEESFRQFAQELSGTGKESAMRLVLINEEAVGAFIPLDEALESLRNRIVLRLAKSPDTLDLLKNRLQSEDIVE
ncbi:MAG TPA: hypothetical protein VH682_14440 [Gemmataceae bacterium]